MLAEATIRRPHWLCPSTVHDVFDKSESGGVPYPLLLFLDTHTQSIWVRVHCTGASSLDSRTPLRTCICALRRTQSLFSYRHGYQR